MTNPFRQHLLVTVVLLLCGPSAFAAGQGSDVGPDDGDVGEAQTITVTSSTEASPGAQRIPADGSTRYQFSDAQISSLPQGESTPINEVMLQAPGVVQDGFGQVHVRGDHGNLQYRINGVMIPDAVGGFGQFLDTRFADKFSILTGALPAQYGYRTAGIVDIQTRAPDSEAGGELSMTGGSRNYGETAGIVNGTIGRFSYDLTGSLMTSQLGINNPVGTLNALHDTTRQAHGFGVLSYDLTPQERLSLIFGQSMNSFQIPDNPTLTPQCCSSTLQPVPPAVALDANQVELNQFQVASLQSSLGQWNMQWSLYHRLSQQQYTPDPNLGDLFYAGVSNAVLRSSDARGIQTDAGWQMNDEHTLHATFMAQEESFLSNDQSQVYCTGISSVCAGNQLTVAGVSSTPPVTLQDNTAGVAHFWGTSLQDEWKILSPLTLNYGLRFDEDNTFVSQHQLSPRLSLVYDYSPATRMHVGYSRFFTPPSTDMVDSKTLALFTNTTNASTVLTNAPVRAERSNYYDMGLSHQLSDHMGFDVDAYYKDVQNPLDEGQFGNSLLFSAFNYQQGKIYGVEFSGNWHEDRLSANINASVSRAMAKGIESGQFNFSPAEIAYINNNWVYMDHDQRYTLSGTVGYRTDWANLSLDTIFGSGLRSGFANTQTMPDYVVFNTSATHLFKTQEFGDLEGRVTVLNLFDRTYELRSGTGIGVGAPQYGFERTFMVGVTRFF